MSSIWWSWGVPWLYLAGNDYGRRGVLCIDYASVGAKPETSLRGIAHNYQTPLTSSTAGSMQPPKSDVGPSGAEPASAAVVLPTSSNDDVTATTSNSTAVSDGSMIQRTLKQGLSRIFARNLQNDDRPITGWHKKTCA